MSEIVIGREDQGTVVEAHAGDVVAIRLEENPTTGYLWKVDEADERVLTFQDSDYAMAAGGGIGGGGTRTLTFKAESPGTTRVKLQNRQEWEPEGATDHFEVTISVR